MNPTNTQLHAQFNDYLIAKGYTTGTAAGFCKQVRYFILWTESQGIPVDTVNYNDILSFISSKKQQGTITASTLDKILRAVRHFYSFMQAECHLNENPASNVEIKGVKRKSFYEILTAEELNELHLFYRSYQGKSTRGSYGLDLSRNRIILGLLLFQGIRAEELLRIQLEDVNVREGAITIRETEKTAGRVLQLQPHQVYDMLDYINNIRKELLQRSGEDNSENKSLFLMKQAYQYSNMLQSILRVIKAGYPKVQNIKQIRASVIANWIKQHNLRQVQYMAGHKYISSTEKYKENNIDALQEDINQYHPLL